jgi:hypothetical protein
LRSWSVWSAVATRILDNFEVNGAVPLTMQSFNATMEAMKMELLEVGW